MGESPKESFGEGRRKRRRLEPASRDEAPLDLSIPRATGPLDLRLHGRGALQVLDDVASSSSQTAHKRRAGSGGLWRPWEAGSARRGSGQPASPAAAPPSPGPASPPASRPPAAPLQGPSPSPEQSSPNGERSEVPRSGGPSGGGRETGAGGRRARAPPPADASSTTPSPAPQSPPNPPPPPKKHKSRHREPPRPIKIEDGSSPQRPSHQIPGFNASRYYRLAARRPVTFKSGLVVERTWRIKLTKAIDGSDEERLEKINAILQHAVTSIVRRAPEGSVAQLFLQNDKLYSEFKASRRCPASQLDVDDVLNQFAAAIQSSKMNTAKEEEAAEDDDIIRLEDTRWTLVLYRPRAVGALSNRDILSIPEYVKKSRGFLDPSRPCYRLASQLKESCLLVAVAAGRERAATSGAVRMVDFLRKRVLGCVKDLAEGAGVPVQGPHRIADLQAIQRFLTDTHQINVYTAQASAHVSYGPNDAERVINLLVRADLGDICGVVGDEEVVVAEVEGRDEHPPSPHHREPQPSPTGHCILITSMPAFRGVRGWCEVCKAPTAGTGLTHRCKSTCPLCFVKTCSNEATLRSFHSACQRCGENLLTQRCADAHETPAGRRKCDAFRRCRLCWVKERRKDFDAGRHKERCGLTFCAHCETRHGTFETCFVRGERGVEGPDPDLCSDGEDGEFAEPGVGVVGRNEAEGQRLESCLDSSSVQPAAQPAQASQSVAQASPSASDKEGSGQAPPPHPLTTPSQRPSASPQRPRSKRKSKLRIYLDAETQEQENGDVKANLVVVHRVEEGTEGFRRYFFTGHDAMRQLAEALLTDPNFEDSILLAINGGKFDYHLLLHELLLLEVAPKLILRGAQILSLKLPKQRIETRDTLLYVTNTPLSAYAKVFELPDQSAKGEYPHRCNTPNFVNFDTAPDFEDPATGDRFPSLAYFCTESLKPAALAKLKKWHTEESEKYRLNAALRYNPTQELIRYCELDVTCLREGMEKWRSSWLAQYPDMPPLKSLTTASLINRILRTKFFKPNTVALIPGQGYQVGNRPSSLEAEGWTALVKAELVKDGETIVYQRDARHQGEVCIAGLRVDLFLRTASGRQIVGQYAGCPYHGCPRIECQRDRGRTPAQEAAYQRTLEEIQRLRSVSADPASPYGPFELRTIWSHEFKESVRDRDSEKGRLWAKFKRLQPRDYLKPRAAFFGGRTSAIKHHVRPDLQAGQRLYYLDFVSLYPSVNASVDGQRWVVGEPRVFVGLEVETEAPPLADVFGLVKCRVLPPRQLKHAVLPQISNDKLLFALCGRCASVRQQGPCFHKDKERAFSGTWFSEELKLAVSKGYAVEHVTEIWHWNQTTTKTFRRFIREFYRKKAVSSKLPDSKEERTELFTNLKASIGLDLKEADIRPNATIRAQAKTALNGCWGFLGRSGQETQSVITGDETKLLSLTNNPEVEVTALRVLHQGAFLRIDYKPKVEKAVKTGNVMLALMTSAYGRIKLYKAMDEQPGSVAYTDTDSLLTLKQAGQERPKSSAALGQLMDEIKEGFSKDHVITSFFTTGPKSYTLTVGDRNWNPVHNEVKVKGLTLSSRALEVVTREQIQQMALTKDPAAAIHVPQFNFSRDILRGRLYASRIFKKFRYSSTKRWVVEGPLGDSFPYGFGADPDNDEEMDALAAALNEAMGGLPAPPLPPPQPQRQA